MLKNEYWYLLAKIGVDTAENGPKVKIWSNDLPILLILSPLYVWIRLWSTGSRPLLSVRVSLRPEGSSKPEDAGRSPPKLRRCSRFVGVVACCLKPLSASRKCSARVAQINKIDLTHIYSHTDLMTWWERLPDISLEAPWSWSQWNGFVTSRPPIGNHPRTYTKYIQIYTVYQKVQNLSRRLNARWDDESSLKKETYTKWENGKRFMRSAQYNLCRRPQFEIETCIDIFEFLYLLTISNDCLPDKEAEWKNSEVSLWLLAVFPFGPRNFSS